MTAYAVIDVDATDAAKAARYRELAGPSVERHGGRYLARGGALHVLEGGWDPQRLVVIEFPSMADLEAFYRSPEYVPLITLRQSASTGDLWAMPGA